MPVTRRTAIKAVGAASGLAAATGTVYAKGKHEDDERDEKKKPDEKKEPKPDEKKEPAPPEAAVRVAHFSPDAPNVDVYVDGEQVLADVAYGDVSPYLEVPPGTYTVTITAAGDPGTVAFEGDVTIESAFYTVAAIGELGATTFEPLVLVDAGSALVRLVHASPDAPAVDVYANDQLVFENAAFGESTAYVAVPAGAYTLDVRPAGDPETTVASFDVTLELATAYSAYAIGYLEPPADLAERAFDLQVTVDGPTAGGGEE